MKTNILYIHGFMGNSKGGTFQALNDFSKKIKDCNIFSFQFDDLHLDVQKTQKQIENYCDKHNINLLIGASLGGFYTLQCKKPIKKIAINPCMIPSIEIPLLKDKVTGENIKIDSKVLEDWKKLEEYKIFSNAFGIFGKQDETFHFDENHNFSPLFEKLFRVEKQNFILIDGKHSLEKEELEKGFFPAIKYFGLECEN